MTTTADLGEALEAGILMRVREIIEERDRYRAALREIAAFDGHDSEGWYVPNPVKWIGDIARAALGEVGTCTTA